MWGEDITAATGEVAALLAERLRIRSASLAEGIARAGRRLPYRVRREAAYLAEAESMAANPRLARLVDPGRFAAAQEAVTAHLAAIDPRERLITRVVGVAATIAFNLLVLAVLLVLLLRWRGFL